MTIQANKLELGCPELPEGEEIEKMASLEHSRLGVLLSYYLVAYIQPLKLGQVMAPLFKIRKARLLYLASAGLKSLLIEFPGPLILA
jgi:hypothetical protein